MKILDNIKFLGYDIEIREDNIKLSYKGEGAPDKNRVLPLLQELKSKKSEAIKILQEDLQPISSKILDDLYMQTMHKINDQYLEGTIKFIEKNYPDLDRQIDDVDNQIKKIWESCLQSKASLNDFKEALASYKSLYMQGIELFRAHLTTEDGNSKDENETLCRRCGKQGERYCYGEDKSGEYKFGDFCLECRPYEES